MNFGDNGRNSSDHSRTETIVIINSVLNVPLILISILGNTLVLLAISRTPSIHSTSMIMLTSLAFSDLLVGLLAQPLFIADEITSLTRQNPILYRLSAMIGFFVAGVSLGTITAISIDRVLALHYHMRYAIIATNTRVKYTVGSIWLVMFLSLGFYPLDKHVFHLMAGVFLALCIIICTVSYAKIYRIVRVHQQQINIQHDAVDNENAGNKMHLSRVKRSAMSTFIFYICMLLCYFPAFVLLTLFGALHVAWKPEWTFSSTLTFMNSSINPFLYCWRLRELREAIVKTTKQLFHPTNEN